MIYYNMKYIIYKIQIKDYIYIGSTKNFTMRKARHKQYCNSGKDFLVYRTIRENGGWDCCTMVPIKEIEVESKRHAEMAEEQVRVEYNAQMNTKRAYVTEEQKKEYQQTPEYKEYQKEYRQTPEHKEYHKEYHKQYHQTPEYKQYQKQYYLAKKAKKADSPEIKVEG